MRQRSHPSDPRGSWALGFVAIVAIVSMMVGCAADVPRGVESLSTPDGLLRVDRTGPGVLYVKPSHSLGSYDDLLVKRVTISYERSQRPLSERDRERVVDMLLESITLGTALGTEQGSVGLVGDPGPCVLEVSFHLVDVQLHESVPSSSHTSFISSFGIVTLVFELRDSVTGEALARYGERRSLGGGPDVGNTGIDTARLAEAIFTMVDHMGEALYDIIPVSTAMRDHSCQGRIAEYATSRAR